MMYNLNFDLHGLGIVGWEEAEQLESILPVKFTRRKDLEEFYIDTKEFSAKVINARYY